MFWVFCCFFAANSQLLILDPVESNYVLTAKEMLASGDYISPGFLAGTGMTNRFCFYLELIAAFKLFGLTSFAARFFSGVFGLIGVFQTYWFANKLYGKRVAFSQQPDYDDQCGILTWQSRDYGYDPVCNPGRGP